MRGDLSQEAQHGLAIKIRIPAGSKKRIVRELWYAGFTPKRIVRGRKGETAEAAVRAQIGI